MNYDSQIKKILRIFQAENKNTIDSNNLQKIDLLEDQNNFIRNTVTIPLVTGYELLSNTFAIDGSFNKIVTLTSSNPWVFSVSLPKYPEWAVPMTKIIPMFYTTDGFNPSLLQGKIQCQHIWNVIPNFDNLGNQISSAISLTITIIVTSVTIPCYMDLNLVFINENIWSEILANKS